MKLFDGLCQRVRAIELAGDLNDVAVLRDGRQVENIRQLELSRAVFDVLIKKLVQYLPGLRAKTVKKLPLSLRGPDPPARAASEWARCKRGSRAGRMGRRQAVPVEEAS